MSEHTSIAVEYASALAHPVRFRLVAALADGPRTLVALASELDAVEAVISYHLEALRDLGLVEAHQHPDGALTYEMLKAPVLWDEAWGELPTMGKRTAAASALTSISARATAAVDRGGFDRDDIHLTRTTMTVDEERWELLTKLFGRVLHELGDLEEQPDPPGETFQATAALLLFTSEHADLDEAPVPAFRDEEAREHAAALHLELAGALAEPVVDWPRVELLAERIRVVARGAKGGPGAPVIPLRRD